MNSSTVAPVASSTLATDSVEGQRRWPSGATRLDLLKEVASSPDFLARPEAESPYRAAMASIALQTCSCVNRGINSLPQPDPKA